MVSLEQRDHRLWLQAALPFHPLMLPSAATAATATLARRPMISSRRSITAEATKQRLQQPIRYLTLPFLLCMPAFSTLWMRFWDRSKIHSLVVRIECLEQHGSDATRVQKIKSNVFFSDRIKQTFFDPSSSCTLGTGTNNNERDNEEETIKKSKPSVTVVVIVCSHGFFKALMFLSSSGVRFFVFLFGIEVGLLLHNRSGVRLQLLNCLIGVNCLSRGSNLGSKSSG